MQPKKYAKDERKYARLDSIGLPRLSGDPQHLPVRGGSARTGWRDPPRFLAATIAYADGSFSQFWNADRADARRAVAPAAMGARWLAGAVCGSNGNDSKHVAASNGGVDRLAARRGGRRRRRCRLLAACFLGRPLHAQTKSAVRPFRFTNIQRVGACAKRDSAFSRKRRIVVDVIHYIDVPVGLFFRFKVSL